MKIDLHVHTAEVSGCSNVPAKQMVHMYKENGYDAVVITDHYYSGLADRCAAEGVPLKDAYLKGYRAAKEEGDKIGLKVFFGCELRFLNSLNDYLVFGVDEDFFSLGYDVFKMNTRDFGKLARERGYLFYQAHPFRNGMIIVNPANLFGIEIANKNPRHDSRNDIAKIYAERHNLHRIGGSDFHEPGDEARGGIITDAEIDTMSDLIQVLKSDNYTVIE